MSDDPRPNTPTPGLLVVDDDPMLLGLLRTVFLRRGFRVWACANGEEAVSVYRRHREEISVVLLDVCMPGLDGPATLAELRRVDAGVRACFMSGHTGRYSLDELFALGALRFYEKPFQIGPFADGLWKLAAEEMRQPA